MDSKKSEQGLSQPETPSGDSPSRLSLHGDLPTRLMLFLCRITPQWCEWVLMYPSAVAVYCLAGQQRRSIASNLRAIPNRRGGWIPFDVYRVFVQFGWTYLESLRYRRGECTLDWETQGLEYLEELVDGTEGAIVLTAHTANYDLATALFTDRIKRRLHVVRSPERNASLNELRRESLLDGVADEGGPLLEVHYNDEDMHLGIILANALRGGEVVAVQADRGDGVVSEMPFDLGGGRVIRLPRGPIALTTIGDHACYPLFVIRAGRRRYKVIAHPPIHPSENAERGPLQERRISKLWTTLLLGFLAEHWDQWFAFDRVFLEVDPKESEGE